MVNARQLPTLPISGTGETPGRDEPAARCASGLLPAALNGEVPAGELLRLLPVWQADG